MKIRCGYEIGYEVRSSSPMILMLGVHPEREKDLLSPNIPFLSQDVETTRYVDTFGNRCLRLVARPGSLTISSEFTIADSGLHDDIALGAIQHEVQDLPSDILIYLLGSRYCEIDRLSHTAWSLFGGCPKGWPLVQTIVDYVHGRLTFGYAHASATRTAFEAHQEGRGVCRDYAHLAVTLCRCLNIPARYTTGYLGDIGVPLSDDPMDFSAWFEVYLGGRRYTFDARHNQPRIGRVVMARGRDAADVALVTSFGDCALSAFRVITEEVTGEVLG